MARSAPANAETRPTLRQRLGDWISGRPGVPATKAEVTTTSDAGWTPIGAALGSFQGKFAGSCLNWSERAGTLWEHPAAALALSFLFDKAVEPRLTLRRPGPGGDYETVPENEVPPAVAPLLALLTRPNPEYDGATLRQITTLSYRLAGNGYWVKSRASRYSPAGELWYIPHWQMVPVEPEDGGPTREFKRTVRGKHGQSVTTLYPREDVIHFKRGIDPKNPRLGLNLFAGVLRELVTDSDIATYTAALLHNFGVSAGLVSSADAEEPLAPEERDTLKGMLDARTTGDQAGSWIVSSLPLKVEPMGTSPKDMDIASLGTRPEARVLAAFGFNAMAIGLPSDDKKYANYREARAAAWEDGILPLLADIAATLTQELLSEFDPTGTYTLGFEYGHIRDLQPDEDKQSARFVAEWKGGVRLLSEARAALGLEEDAGIDGYSWQLAPGKANGSGTDNGASTGNSA